MGAQFCFCGEFWGCFSFLGSRTNSLEAAMPWERQESRDALHSSPDPVLAEVFQPRGGTLGSPCDTALSFS